MKVNFLIVLSASFSIVSANKIVGGIEAQEDSAPFYTSLYFNNGSHVLFFCGGTIIHQYFVLTAGHCVEWLQPNQLRMVVGSNDLRYGSTFYYADKFIIHDRLHKPGRYHNDIALIRVNKKIQFNEKVQMIEISDEEVPVNSLLTLFGFGRTGTFEPPSVKLLEIKLKHINSNECSQRYSDYANVDISVVKIVGDGHLCTYNEKSQGSCQGDSGSPLIYNNQTVAIVSSISADGCAKGVPDIQTRLSFFHDWIQANIHRNL